MANETTVNRTFKSTVFSMVFEDKRNLLELYNAMTGKLYGTKIVQIPPPEFVIFYNGEKDIPEKKTVRLSDMYGIKVNNPKLELETLMLNISGKNNSRLKETCRALKDYAAYTDKIRYFLMKHRAEAKAMSIFEYDQEKHIRQEREEAWEDGQASGLKLAETIFRLFREGKTIEEISAGCDLPAEQIRELLGQEE